ncbi:MAG: hypothetical protein NTY15_07895 [Planctomycetota bacterium]|nr:hypothetical protein [Planctomycetota bacterium]
MTLHIVLTHQSRIAVISITPSQSAGPTYEDCWKLSNHDSGFVPVSV